MISLIVGLCVGGFLNFGDDLIVEMGGFKKFNINDCVCLIITGSGHPGEVPTHSSYHEYEH